MRNAFKIFIISIPTASREKIKSENSVLIIACSIKWKTIKFQNGEMKKN